MPREKARFLWPQLGHSQTATGNRQAEVLRGHQFSLQPLSPTPLVKAASPRRHAAMCGCAGVTGLGQVGGGVLVLAARRPFQTWLSESCLILLCLPLPFPYPDFPSFPLRAFL